MQGFRQPAGAAPACNFEARKARRIKPTVWAHSTTLARLARSNRATGSAASDKIEGSILVARYLGPKAKLARREGTDLYLKSARRSSATKAKFETKPGQHGRTSVRAPATSACSCARSRRSSACMACWSASSAATLPRPSAARQHRRQPAVILLESRLDNVVYRMGLARRAPKRASWCRRR